MDRPLVSSIQFQRNMIHNISDHKLTDKVKITILRNVTNLPLLFDTFYSKSLKLFGHIKNVQSSLNCALRACYLEKEVDENQDRYGELILWSPTNKWHSQYYHK